MSSLVENCSSREYPSAVDKLNYPSKILSLHTNNHLNFKVDAQGTLQAEKETDADSGCNESITSPTKSDDTLEGKQDNKLESSEDSKLLRDILQNKEKAMENNNIEEARIPESADRKKSEGHMMKNIISSFSQQQEDDRTSLHSDSGDESDYGSSGEPMVNGDDLDDGNDNDSASDNGLYGQEDSKEAKRARVENILSNMRPASAGSGDQHGLPLQEVRRQKRKQNQPTQHEPNWADPSSPKYRRMEERMALQEQLVKLQQQLHLVQKRYVELYDEDQDGENNVRFSGRDYFVERNFPERSILDVPKVKDVKVLQNQDKSMKGTPSILDSLSSPKSLQDSDKKSDKQNIPLQKLDIENLSNSLKSGLSNILTQTVDDIVQKYIQERSAKLIEKEREKKRKEEEAMKEAKQKEETRQRHPDIPLNPGLLPLRDPFPDLRHDHIGHMARILEKASAFDAPRGVPHDLHRPPHHSLPFHIPFSYFPPQMMHPPSLYSCAPPSITEPEQTEALPLVVNGSSGTPKKKRTKVTDTRLSPRAARALLGQDPIHLNPAGEMDRHPPTSFPTLIPPVLPTSVAIPNPSLQESNLMSYYRDHTPFSDLSSRNHSPMHRDNYSPSTAPSPADSLNTMMKFESMESGSDSYDNPSMQMTSTLTPMHLRKAKLMFFYVRYPSSAILKVYFPDVKFNKNNTAQLVKWFSNFREFYYIQMEKYARQAIAEGCKSIDDLVVTTESELYRVLNLHYNRNNQIEVPDNFRIVVQATLREFYKSIVACKDSEPSWKKAIYKVIARMDDSLPEYFKSPNWMDQLGDM